MSVNNNNHMKGGKASPRSSLLVRSFGTLCGVLRYLLEEGNLCEVRIHNGTISF